jgi:hypothetical protein
MNCVQCGHPIHEASNDHALCRVVYNVLQGFLNDNQPTKGAKVSVMDCPPPGDDNEDSDAFVDFVLGVEPQTPTEAQWAAFEDFLTRDRDESGD